MEVCQAHGFIIDKMEPIIFLDNVTFRYPGEENTRDILRGLSLEIFPGDMVAVVGSNGSGKTTMLRLMNGLLIPQSGRVLVNGLDTSRKDQLMAIRRQVGLVFQHPEDQIVATTVAEDVAFGPENLGLSSAEIRARVDQALKAVGMEEHAQRSPHMLSGGQTQRLALAGVLAMRPQVVLFDEATTMLDPAGRLMAIQEMQRLEPGRDDSSVYYPPHGGGGDGLAGGGAARGQGGGGRFARRGIHRGEPGGKIWAGAAAPGPTGRALPAVAGGDDAQAAAPAGVAGPPACLSRAGERDCAFTGGIAAD